MPDDCRNCVEMASKEVITACPRATQALIWKEDCMVRYSDQSFFSLLEENPHQVLYNYDKATDDADNWVKLVNDTLSEVASTAAASNKSGNKFATKETYVSSLNKHLYTLAQCNPDLTTEDCNMCFLVANSRLQVWLSHRGGILLTPTCAIRFEVYEFYNNSGLCLFFL
ncbi:putative cysteine-rich receptor-like protein kinase 9 [Spinacia oleracea]|uniref:Cysteine-rich receptor-like protein kinase 9 n=1 Tax=Spinacia oleracea TaxID=3562 RepID=A0A9R0J552_SPIOL|nr:putative cysteine-rich receptor-like protein kinase 9 [Spinacia oleracea]